MNLNTQLFFYIFLISCAIKFVFDLYQFLFYLTKKLVLLDKVAKHENECDLLNQ
jgi:hypothetical protein